MYIFGYMYMCMYLLEWNLEWIYKTFIFDNGIILVLIYLFVIFTIQPFFQKWKEYITAYVHVSICNEVFVYATNDAKNI